MARSWFAGRLLNRLFATIKGKTSPPHVDEHLIIPQTGNPPPSQSDERRQSSRRWGDPEAVILGSSIMARVALAPETIPWVELAVRDCREEAGRWVWHCEFLQALPKDILLLFK
jgi:hypothetical protein